MKKHGNPGLLIGAALWFAATIAPAQITVLHAFSGGADGSCPNGSLVLAGANLLGLTPYGGNSDLGALFRIAPGGGNYALLRHGTANDLDQPWGSLTPAGSLLYGTTRYGGAHTAGTIFQIGADGAGYAVSHDFSGSVTGGGDSWSDLLLSGAVLYGMSSGGGTANAGTIFRLGADGTGFALRHSFSGGAADGASPLGSLTLAGTALYGMTSHGGSANYGTLFQLGAGGGPAILHHFAGGPADGAQPWGSLTLVNAALYGMTPCGGSFGNGALFRINTDGSGYALLHSFSGSAADGAKPYGSLALAGAALYGMTSAGGSGKAGTIFKINTDGGGYATLHHFTGGSDGGSPRGSLTRVGAALYGMTGAGGAGQRGVIFSIPLPASGARDSGMYDMPEHAPTRGGRSGS